MNWQIRYQLNGRSAMRLVQGLDAAIHEAARLFAQGLDVRRIEAPSAGCAISADAVRELCRRKGLIIAASAGHPSSESMNRFAAAGHDPVCAGAA